MSSSVLLSTILLLASSCFAASPFSPEDRGAEREEFRATRRVYSSPSPIPFPSTTPDILEESQKRLEDFMLAQALINGSYAYFRVLQFYFQTSHEGEELKKNKLLEELKLSCLPESVKFSLEVSAQRYGFLSTCIQCLDLKDQESVDAFYDILRTTLQEIKESKELHVQSLSQLKKKKNVKGKKEQRTLYREDTKEEETLLHILSILEPYQSAKKKAVQKYMHFLTVDCPQSHMPHILSLTDVAPLRRQVERAIRRAEQKMSAPSPFVTSVVHKKFCERKSEVLSLLKLIERKEMEASYEARYGRSECSLASNYLFISFVQPKIVVVLDHMKYFKTLENTLSKLLALPPEVPAAPLPRPDRKSVV